MGKSSTARELERRSRFRWVREVNALFRPPLPRTPHWYDARQVQRDQMARQYGHAVLDGDPFQSLWYGWTYPEFTPDLPETLAFYRQNIQSGTLHFPDFYFVLQASETVLRERKASDLTRTRQNFEHHLKLLETQPIYFQALARLMPRRVVFLNAVSVAENVRQIEQFVAQPVQEEPEALTVFAGLVAFLAS